MNNTISEQICNPLTKRFIHINGKVGQSLLIQHLKKEVRLNSKDVCKPEVRKKLSELKKKFKKVYGKKWRGGTGTKETNTDETSRSTVDKKIKSVIFTKDKATTTIQQATLNIVNKKRNIQNRLKQQSLQNFCEASQTFLDQIDKKSPPTLDALEETIIHYKIDVVIPITSMYKYSFYKNPSKPKYDLHFLKISAASFMNYHIGSDKLRYTQTSLDFYKKAYDYKWLKASLEYINNLDVLKKMTLVQYTGDKGAAILNLYSRHTEDKEWKKHFNAYTEDTLFEDLMGLKEDFTEFPFLAQYLRFIESDDFKTNYTKYIKADKLNELNEPEPCATASQNTHLKQLEKLKNVENLYNPKYVKHALKLVEFLKEEIWETLLKEFENDLKAIFRNAPPLNNAMYVYRGVHDDQFVGETGSVYKVNTFLSTTLNLDVAVKFAAQKCCIKRITLLPGTKCLLLAGISKFPNEAEVLLNIDTKFYITETTDPSERSLKTTYPKGLNIERPIYQQLCREKQILSAVDLRDKDAIMYKDIKTLDMVALN